MKIINFIKNNISSGFTRSAAVMAAAVIILAALGTYAYLNNKTTDQLNNEVNENNAQEVLVNIATEFNLHGGEIEHFTSDWTQENGEVIPLSGYSISIADSQASAAWWVYNEAAQMGMQALDMEFLNNFNQKIGDILKAKGFIENKNNYYSQEGRLVYAYEKEDLKCLIHLFNFSGPFSIIFCGTYDQEQHELRKEISSLFDYSENFVWINKLEGNYAVGSRGVKPSGGLGGIWIAVNENGSWKIVGSGHEPISCAVAEKYSIPSNIAPCVEY